MRSNDLNLENLLDVFYDGESLYFRALVRKTEEGWKVYCLRIDNLSDSRNIRSAVLKYDDIGFIFGKTSPREILRWINDGKIFYGKEEYPIPKLQSNINEYRYPSNTDVSWLRIKLPFSTYEISFDDRDNLPDRYDPLISSNLPSFPSLYSAVYFYLFDRADNIGNAIPHSLMIFIANHECWLDKIYLRSSSIKLGIRGTKVNGCRLEIRAGFRHYETILKKQGDKLIPLPDGLPEAVWIAITRGKDWLDYRKLDLRIDYSLKGGNVISEIEDKQTELKGIIARGENETTEFKEEIPSRIEKLTKTVAAFANGNGGVIIVGVDDDGTIIGINGNVNKENIRLMQLIRSNVLPQPSVTIDSVQVDGEWLLAVWVKPGDFTPYGVNPKSPRYYVRRSASSMIATPEEIRVISRGNLTTDFTDTWGLFRR